MNRILYLLTFIAIPFLLFSQATPEKKPLDHSVYESWKTIDSYDISDHGKWMFYETNPQKGDGILTIESLKNSKKRDFERGYNCNIPAEENFAAFLVKPQYDTIRELKLKKVKKTKLPKDSLYIWVFEPDTIFTFANIKAFKTSEENNNWVAIHFDKAIDKEKKTKAPPATPEKKKKEKTKKKKKAEEPKKKEVKITDSGTNLWVFNPLSRDTVKFSSITEVEIASRSPYFAMVQTQKDSSEFSKTYLFDGNTGKTDTIFQRRGITKKLTLSNEDKNLVFIHSEDTAKTKVYSLYISLNGTPPSVLVDTLTPEITDQWTVAENGKIYFSDDDSKLYFGVAPKPEAEKEDTLLEDEKVKVDVWHYNDPEIQPEQLKNLDKEKKRTYLTVYHINDKKIIQLGDTIFKDVYIRNKWNSNTGVCILDEEYKKSTTWKHPGYCDIYTIDILSGEKQLIYKKNYGTFATLSTDSRYILRYDLLDKNWYSYSIKDNKEICLTQNTKVNFHQEDDDTPSDPDPYGFAGWSENDENVLIYDRYDIWMFDPLGERQPVCLTQGRKDSTVFRYLNLDEDIFHIDLSNELILKSEHTVSRQEGYHRLNINSGKTQKLLLESYSLTTPKKAKASSELLFRKESFVDYPEIWSTDLSFEAPTKRTNTNPQQANYLWGSVETIRWKPYKGDSLSGLLYKPENFDPAKKYSMLVYFYEKYSQRINTHYIPKPSRSVINFPLYVSNDYVIFVPDIIYNEGQPGEDAYNCIVSGTEFVISQGFVDKAKIGIQGQSWGGYQVSYLVTRTNMYAAAEAGAPVSNMTSAYGGIRWGSGIGRAFQYETGQSRIGKSLWESRSSYIDNSPLFFADKVTTPLLIMHNDHDGSVPWYQGIEYYIALRRLGKQVWMLTYNDEDHNLKNWPNCVDLSIRMKQFFDHYLKDEPAPVWMTDGLPAIKKGESQGYEISEPAE